MVQQLIEDGLLGNSMTFYYIGTLVRLEGRHALPAKSIPLGKSNKRHQVLYFLGIGRAQPSL